VSRALIEFHVEQQFLSKGIVPLSWKILERNDGAVVQLIYVGPPRVKLKLTGTVEGRSPILPIQFPGTIRSASEQLADLHNDNKMLFVGMFGATAILMLVLAVLFSRHRYIYFLARRDRSATDSRGSSNRIAGAFFSMAIFYGAVAVYELYRIMSVPTPPFAN
jgi:hypothetical protein